MFDKVTSAYILKWAKKIKLVNYRGGKCVNCGTNDIFVLTFHHKNKEDKEFDIIFALKSFHKLKKESEKCILLCHNCHRKHHEIENRQLNRSELAESVSKKRNKNKKLFLKFKQNNGCSKCGYNDCNTSLSFHHLKNKKISISNISKYFNDISEITKDIKHELDKCIVVCENCHKKIHIDVDRFDKYKKEIYDKTKTYKELYKVNEKELLELRKQGLSYNQICKKMKCVKSSVNNILKKYNLNGPLKK